MVVFVDYENRDTLDMTNDILSDEKYCKKLLGIYLNTSSAWTINRYYSVYKKLRRNGHFDPDIEGGGFSWNWSAFCFGPFFFWYRKRYGYMVGVVLAMCFLFFPGLILSGAVADLAVLNDFALTIATAIDDAESDNEIVRKYNKIEKNAEENIIIKFLTDNILPFVEQECKKNGGTNLFAYVLPILIIVLAFIASD